MGNLIALQKKKKKVPSSSQQSIVFKQKRGKHTGVERLLCIRWDPRVITAAKLNLSLEDATLFTAKFFKRKKNLGNHRLPFL